MPIPDFQTLMLPVLKLAAEKEWRVSDTVERLATDFKLSQEDRAALLPSGRQPHSQIGLRGQNRTSSRPV